MRTELQLAKSAGAWLDNQQKEAEGLRQEVMALRQEVDRGEGSLRENRVLREEVDRMQGLLANRQVEYDKLLQKHYEDVKQLSARSADN